MGKKAALPRTFDCTGGTHRQCVEDAMARAIEKCRQDGLRLTPTRRRVLELIWHSHQPKGAYQLMEDLRAERDRVAPPTVYRALRFLVDAGLVHRIDSLNAYVGCTNPEPHHGACLMICEACGKVAEVDDPEIRTALSRCIARVGFKAAEEVIELKGVCPSCDSRH